MGLFPKIIIGFLVVYWTTGVIRTALSWKGNRAHIDGTGMADFYPPPWAYWIICVISWPTWWSDYHQWRTETKLIKLGEKQQNRAGRSDAQDRRDACPPRLQGDEQVDQ